MILRKPSALVILSQPSLVDLPSWVTTHRLPKMDAVLYTSHVISRLRGTEQTRSNLDSLGHLYIIPEMPEAYKETIVFCAQQIFALVLKIFRLKRDGKMSRVV